MFQVQELDVKLSTSEEGTQNKGWIPRTQSEEKVKTIHDQCWEIPKLLPLSYKQMKRQEHSW